MESTSSHLKSLRSILIVSSHLHPCLSSSLFPSNFSNLNCVYISHLSHACYTPFHLILLDLITLIILVFGEASKLRRFSLCSPLQPPATSFSLCTSILLSTLFSDTLNLYSSLSVRDQVSHL